MEDTNRRMHHLSHALHTVSPLATLERGYAIVSHGKNKTIVRDSAQLKSGEIINTQLASGEVESLVQTIRNEDK